MCAGSGGRGYGTPSAARPEKSCPWGSTNRVVSNRVVSKGPLYPSKTEMFIFVVFDTTPFICL